jgi:hypothetical protein
MKWGKAVPHSPALKAGFVTLNYEEQRGERVWEIDGHNPYLDHLD